MVRYDPYTDSFIDNPTKETTATINLDAFPKNIIQMNVVEVSDASIEKIADAVVRKLADRKTENNSEKPNNCEHITEDGVTCAKYPACGDCLDNPLNKLKGSERLVKGSEQTDLVEDSPSLVKDLVKAFGEDGTWLERQGVYTLTLAEAKQRAVDIIESVLAKDEPTISKMEQVDEPQYEMGMGTLKCDNCSEYGSFKCTKCDGEMYFKRLEPKDEPQFDKDINVRSKTEPKTQTETQNSNLTFEKDECAKEYEELGLKELKELIEADRKTEPQRGCDADCNEDCTECARESELWRAEQTEPQTDIGTSDTVYSDTAGYVPRADMTDCSWR